MKNTSLTLSSLVLLLVAACGSNESPATSPSASVGDQTAAGNSSADDTDNSDIIEGCTAMFVRQRECGDVFLPALVDLRVRLDAPEGIAAIDAEKGRDYLLAVAQEEWAVDSTDESIAATCAKIAADVPREDLEELAPLAQECLAKTECESFVECSLPIHEARLK